MSVLAWVLFLLLLLAITMSDSFYFVNASRYYGLSTYHTYSWKRTMDAPLMWQQYINDITLNNETNVEIYTYYWYAIFLI